MLCYAMLCLLISMAQITPRMLRSHPGHPNHFLDAQITPQTLRLQVLLCYACSFPWLRSVPRCSDRSLEAQITPWTLKSLPRPSDYKSCYAMLCYAMLCYAMLCYAMLCYACSFRWLRSLPRCSDRSLDAQITPWTLKSPSQTLRLLVLLVHFDGSYHPPDAQITPWTLKSLPGRSNHTPDLQITSLAVLCLFISMTQISPQTLLSVRGQYIIPWTISSSSSSSSSNSSNKISRK